MSGSYIYQIQEATFDRVDFSIKNAIIVYKSITGYPKEIHLKWCYKTIYIYNIVCYNVFI